MRRAAMHGSMAMFGLLLWLPIGCGDDGAGPSGLAGGGGSRPVDPTNVPSTPPPSHCEPPATDLLEGQTPVVVGDGSAGSCTEGALRDAIAGGGRIEFDCGDAAVTIEVASQLVVTADTVLAGGGKVTLSGGGRTRILFVRSSFERSGPQLTVVEMRFEDALASGEHVDGGGGAILYVGGSVTAVDSTFVNNRAVQSGPDVAGGAIYGRGAGETRVIGSTFAGNGASSGGAIGALGTAVRVWNSRFEQNHATGAPADLGGSGGAIYVDGGGREVEICGSTFTENSGNTLGGAIFRTGYETERNDIHLCSFDGNFIADVDDGADRSAGALYLQGVHVRLTRSSIVNHRGDGAAVRVLAHGDAEGVLEMENVTLAGNATYERDDVTMRAVGGALAIGDGARGTVRNCTFADNAAQFGSAIWGADKLAIHNCVFDNFAENEWTPVNCNRTGEGDHNVEWPEPMGGATDCTPGIARFDPRLGELGDHGGPTVTIAPDQDSPLLEKTGQDCPDTDQRGEPRAEPCTLGAYEVTD